jgi:UDP-glucose 4-epimerase
MIITPPATDWVVGRGLLGGALERHLDGKCHYVSIPWSDETRAIRTLSAAAERFFSANSGFPIRVWWCAGRGVTSTPRTELDSEVRVFEHFLEALRPAASRVTLFLASSVGGAYGGRSDPPFSESTPPIAASAYGDAKLAMERAVQLWAGETGGLALIARITNLYGPGQSLDKGQGIISTILRSHLAQAPATIHVNLDTLRDYVFVDDCATVASAAMARLESQPAGTVVTKIIGSMDAVSIAAVIGEVKRLRRNVAPILVGQGHTVGQASDLRVISTVWTDLDCLARTTLPAGIHATFEHMRLQHAVHR